jgi:putative membrane protein
MPLLFAAIAATVAVPAAGAKSNSRVSAADEQYLKTSMAGDLFEITGGKLAKAKSDNQAVIKLANTLITDHTNSLEDTVKLAHRVGVGVPTSPLPSMVWELNALASMRGKAFNHWYASLEVSDHLQDIQETSDEVKDGTNSRVRRDARNELPMLRMHLNMARAALAKS